MYRIIYLVIVLTLFITNYSFSKAPEIKNGVLDLRDWSFENNGEVRLIGQWEFYWNKILF